jgi:ribosome biogenesis GTPase
MNLKNIGWNKYFRDNFKKHKKAGFLPARVVSELKKTYILLSSRGELTASARGILWHNKNISETPVVGDWVAIKLLADNESASISHILPRKSKFSRKAAGGRKRYSGGKAIEQVIAANVDLGIIVIGLDQDFSLRRIERYLALVTGSGSKPLIILNKTDLDKGYKKKKNEATAIAKGIHIITMSALKMRQVKVLEQYIKEGKTAALLGSSGVGKSTIINQLLGYEKQKVKEISSSVGKGQHTTSQRELIILPNGGLIIDNPGMREVQLWSDEENLSDVFTDIETIARDCRFRNCQHKTEPGCAVKLSLEKGEINQNRVDNYLKMKLEISLLGGKGKRKGKSKVSSNL